MGKPSQHSDAPRPAPGTAPTSGHAPGEALSVEEAIEQARQLRQSNAEGIARRLGRGERLSAEVLYDILHTQTLAGWWLLIDRQIRHARGDRLLRGLTPEHTVARFVSWISPYLDGDAIALEAALSVRVLGLRCEYQLALAHLDRALALIRQDAARDFLTQVKTLVPASSAEQATSSSAGREAKA
ncbi:hypothetical protein HII36_42385 [Nonomuraea sp. NN258]|uniref:hypothetical protein n=1 Tax=Nonomuraea antri TaxID=2730852 RepID=UPI00156961D9|nr:hypothetical protein [Nonomuraea antri]NRQ38432.1 hypothetical protein [Nonomuraea antri]